MRKTAKSNVFIKYLELLAHMIFKLIVEIKYRKSIDIV